MSLSTTFSHVIFGLPLPLLSSTVISILFFTQSFPSFLNTCPIHLSLLRLITSLIFSMPILSLSSAFVFFSLSDTPHIHLTILISALSSFASCSAFTAHVSLPYIIELRAHTPYVFPLNLNATCAYVIINKFLKIDKYCMHYFTIILKFQLLFYRVKNI